MTEEALRPFLRANGLERVADALQALATPTIRVYAERAEERAIPVGASKFGGRPDLPEGVAWPAWHEPMAFIAQFNLAEIAPYDRDGELPISGLLSFFYETDGEPLYSAGWGLPEGTDPTDYPPIDESLGWRVLYHEGDPTALTRRALPPELNEQVRFPSCAVRFAAEVSLPDVDSREVAALGLSGAERSALIGLEYLINRGTWEEGGHHLLGHPYNLGEPTLLGCEMGARRLSFESIRAEPARRKVLAEATARWRLLFQIDSGEAAAMDWSGGGVLHYCIERDALRARDFSRVWLNLQFL